MNISRRTDPPAVGTSVNWTLPKLTRFKAAYARAVRAGVDAFMFGEHQFVVSYAKYLIEYLSRRTNPPEVGIEGRFNGTRNQ